MRLGLFARSFSRPTVEEVLEAVAAHGVTCLQFNFACAGLPTLAEEYPQPLLERVRDATRARGLHIAALSGTWNMIHPDQEERRAGLRRLPALLRAARFLEVPVVTLCTGTRDPQNMWRAHPANDDPEAWQDLLTTLKPALAAAAEQGVTLGIEPETANVVNTAAKARALLDHFGSTSLGIVLDAANLLRPEDRPRQREVLAEAFRLLGKNLVLAHAKEWDGAGHPDSLRVGAGVLDWDHYLSLLRQARFDGPLILHGFAEGETASSLSFLRARLPTSGSPD